MFTLFLLCALMCFYSEGMCMPRHPRRGRKTPLCSHFSPSTFIFRLRQDFSVKSCPSWNPIFGPGCPWTHLPLPSKFWFSPPTFMRPPGTQSPIAHILAHCSSSETGYCLCKLAYKSRSSLKVSVRSFSKPKVESQETPTTAHTCAHHTYTQVHHRRSLWDTTRLQTDSLCSKLC